MEEAARKKVIFSGIQPSGDLTLGSYMGAIKNWVALSDEYECYYCIVDMHAITVRQVPADLRRRALSQLAQYIACGLDPKKNTLFIQSHVPAHAQLGWVLDCYTMFGELSRMTQFKDKSSKNADNINAGLFTYPALMAADILLYQTDLVPVGGDQKQHVEICRDIAMRFNNIYGDVFTIPEPYIPPTGARIMSLTSPENKMSKSDKDPGGCIYIMQSPDDIMRCFKRAVTDSETGHCVYACPEKLGVTNLMQIYSVCTGKTMDEIEAEFDGMGYGAFKPVVGEAVVELLRPIAAVLPDYMAPWTRQIPDLAEQWDTFFQGNSAQEFFLQRARIQSGEFRELRLAFRFFSPYGSPGKFLGEKGRLLFHMGVNMQPGLGNAGQAQAPEEWELTALRLMANGSRMEMLHAMAERPMSGQELAQKLNLNSGSVFRDLNSLYNARLLLMESTGGRNCYRTNLPVVRNMMERMLNYLQNQG